MSSKGTENNKYQTNKQTNKQTDKQTNKQTNEIEAGNQTRFMEFPIVQYTVVACD